MILSILGCSTITLYIITTSPRHHHSCVLTPNLIQNIIIIIISIIIVVVHGPVQHVQPWPVHSVFVPWAALPTSTTPAPMQPLPPPPLTTPAPTHPLPTPVVHPCCFSSSCFVSGSFCVGLVLWAGVGGVHRGPCWGEMCRGCDMQGVCGHRWLVGHGGLWCSCRAHTGLAHPVCVR